MKLDREGRIDLEPRPPGFKLSFDGVKAVYCRDVCSVLSYVAEHLMSSVDGDIVDGLRAVARELGYCRRLVLALESVDAVARALAKAEKGGGDRRRRVEVVALELSGCPDIDVFRSSNQARETTALAKVIVETWSEKREGRREEAAVGSPPEELATGL